MTTITLTPFKLSEYFRDHAPDAARAGMRGYILRTLVDMARLRGRDVGLCWPSVAYLARLCGRSIRHVRRMLSELERLGEIQRIPQRRADGGHGANLYRLRGLLSWAAKNVRGVSDKGDRKTPTGRISNPSRGGKSVFGKPKFATPCPAPAAARVEATGQAKTGLGGVLSDPSAPTGKPAGLSPVQVEEARRLCDPGEWHRLRLAAAADGTAGDLDAAAAKRWRAGAIMRGVKLMA